MCYNTPSGIKRTNKAYDFAFRNQKPKWLYYHYSWTKRFIQSSSSPSLTFPGVLENKYQEVDCSAYGQYFYYDGSLEEKFGIYELIEGFQIT